jgi:hypothetical protein
MLGPLLLLLGLRAAPAASVSLWLNLELAATLLLGALLFRDPLGRRGAVDLLRQAEIRHRRPAEIRFRHAVRDFCVRLLEAEGVMFTPAAPSTWKAMCASATPTTALCWKQASRGCRASCGR